jgi:hypothetical protein
MLAVSESGPPAGTAFGFSSALARSIKPMAFPVPSGSMPYSAGNTATTRTMAATISAITVASAIFPRDGASSGCGPVENCDLVPIIVPPNIQ